MQTDINMMKKVVLGLLVFVFLFAVLMFVINIFPSYEHTYLKSQDGKNIVTRLDYDGKTYFTYGKYDADAIPENYIKPEFSGFSSGFEVILYFENDTAYLYAHYGQFTQKGVEKRLKVKVYDGYGNDPIFNDMKNDNTGKYLVISNY